jgi:hypothetical protein
MENSQTCKGCSATVWHSFENVKEGIEDYLKTIDSEQRVSDDLYQKRLSQCIECDGLYYGSTCRFCGCFVQIRALKKSTDCPNPEGSKWYTL